MGWRFYYDPGATGTFYQFGPLATPGFTHGTPMGETGRFPDSDTGLKDHQQSLQYRPCGTCYVTLWEDNETLPGSESPPNWHYYKVSAIEYWLCPDWEGFGHACP